MIKVCFINYSTGFAGDLRLCFSFIKDVSAWSNSSFCFISSWSSSLSLSCSMLVSSLRLRKVHVSCTLFLCGENALKSSYSSENCFPLVNWQSWWLTLRTSMGFFWLSLSCCILKLETGLSGKFWWYFCSKTVILVWRIWITCSNSCIESSLSKKTNTAKWQQPSLILTIAALGPRTLKPPTNMDVVQCLSK